MPRNCDSPVTTHPADYTSFTSGRFFMILSMFFYDLVSVTKYKEYWLQYEL